MSVINQMLKDLDKRQGEQAQSSNVVIPTTTKNSSFKVLTIIIIVIILVNIAGIFVWQLYSENQSLKTQAQQSSTETSQINLSERAVKNSTAANTQSESNQEKNSQAKNTQIEKALVKSGVGKETPGTQLVKAIESTLSTSAAATKLASQDIANNEQAVTAQKEQETMPSELPTSKSVEPKPGVNLPLEAPVVKSISTVPARKSTLKISRSQLSPKALADKKITEAERAMEVNNVAKAESLFEEVLLLLPEHETARKQLAALWYGKKAYQDAVSLLSQGIAISPQNEEMRLMSARIYFEQGQAKQALNVLMPINNSKSVEVQVLIANVAAELNEHKTAANAYRKLLALEPNIGRWWLGLAVSLDSQGQFSLARNAYNQAILQANLSSNALQFARQRVSELGE